MSGQISGAIRSLGESRADAFIARQSQENLEKLRQDMQPGRAEVEMFKGSHI